jgi:valyl-tRNA synthetase
LAARIEPATALSTAGVEVYLALDSAVTPEVEGQRLEKALAKVEAQMARSRELLANESFLTKAPTTVVARQKSRLADLEEQAATIQAQLARLKKT